VTATNPTEASASTVPLVDARLQNEEGNNGSNLTPEHQEDNENFHNYYGDFPGKVQEGHIRIAFVNIYGIPATTDHPKNSNIREAINQLGSTIVGLAETNISWKKLSGGDRWEERSRGWWEFHKFRYAYNSRETPHHTHQPGGTMLLSRGQPSLRNLKQGTDPSKLGRWSWALFSGKRGICTRVITAYRPCISQGLKSTYMQQKRYFNAIKKEVCPRNQMLDDLILEITQWLNEGNQIILMLDLNDDVTDSMAHNKLKNIGLVESITSRHAGRLPFPTCSKGTRAIDGIYVSTTIKITKGGYLPFDKFPTDHRPLWIDVSMTNIFGNDMAPLLQPQARRLKCNDPVTQKKWIKLYNKYLSEHKAIDRAFQLQTIITRPLQPYHIREYEKIRKIRMNARKYADKRCRKLHMGNVPFSEELAKARTLIELWKTIYSWKLGKKGNMKRIQRLEKRANLQGSREVSLGRAKENRDKAYSQYWIIKKQAKDLRLTFLQNKAKELAHHLNQEESNVFKQLIRREAQRDASRKIKFTLNRIHGGGVSKISQLNGEGIWEETTEKQAIEQGCAMENERKYRQTEDTPCMQGQLAHDLGFLGNTAASQAILDGSYTPPPDTDQYTIELLRHLKYHPKALIQAPQAIMTTEAYREGWKNKKEYTSAGKSGWTFSHSKTCALDRLTADFEATMAHIPYITGYAPKEWKTGVNIMIYKKDNLDRVDKLRTIVLKEADANFNDGKLGKEMMAHAETHGMIAREQYGSRKGHTSITHAVNKRLSFDLLRLLRAPGALCSNDAKSCYDRILHSIASLAMKRLGIPEPPIECMFQCIQQMEHFIRTTHGDSNSSYSSKHTLIPFQGVLQGNGAAPSIWVAVSTPLLNMMRTANHGLHITSSISQEQSSIVAFAFVDDTDLVQGSPNRINITAQEVMENMQEAILRWEGGLKATGGAIVPEKSFVYPIDFKFNTAGKATYKTVEEIGAHFEVPDAQGNTVTLRQLEASDAEKTLGVILAPDGNNKQAVEALRKSAEEWSALVKTGHLQAKDVWLALNTTIMKSIEYPLMALTLTEKQCKMIMSPILNVALPAAQVCRNYPRDVAYGPKELIGLGVNNIYLTQGTQQIGLLHQYLSTNTITGELMRACIEAHKMHIGFGTNMFELNYERLHRLTPPTWITNIWKFSNSHHISVQEDITGNTAGKRENDRHIMDIVSEDQEMSNNDLVHINRCRLFLQVVTVADIANGNGTLLRRGVLKGTMMKMNRNSYQWPRQDRPGINAWRLWRKALKRNILRGVGLHLKPNLYLGSWIDGARDKWDWFYVRATQRIYQRLPHRWKAYGRRGRGPTGTNSPYQYISDSFNLPPSALRCTVFRDSRRRLRLSGAGREGDTRQDDQQERHMILNEVYCNGDESKVIDAIRSGTAKAVSDGSFLKEQEIGTAAWVIEGNNPNDYILGSYETPGARESQCSHRSETFGLLGTILTVNAICTSNNITEGSITAKCDGEGIIKLLQWLHPITKNSRKHFDLLLAIQRAVEVSPLQWQFTHLAGHQDDHTDYSQLDRWAQLNILVDLEAKKKLTTILRDNNRQGHNISIPYNKCTVSWITEDGRLPISSHMAKTLRHGIQHKIIKEYWVKKKEFMPQTSAIIDWTSLEKSAKSYGRWKWLSKFVSGICGVGIMLQMWKYQEHNTCPRCGHPREDVQHTVTCGEYSATQTWEDSVEELARWMTENDAAPNMKEAIITGLRAWRTNSPMTIQHDGSIEVAMAQQARIGWYNFLNGFIARQWRLIQRQHLLDIGSQKSARLWMTRLQHHIWEMAWKMWQHRNEYLHKDGSTIHFQENAAVDDEIRREYSMSVAGLPTCYNHLFTTNLIRLLRSPISIRRDWLISVWAARDHHTPLHGRQRNVIAIAYYKRWKEQMEMD
jgi:hypothetical protein